jgi:phenylpropionate dioxygenase-like ring-hydroxylating dioxygenase large terminal subunit
MFRRTWQYAGHAGEPDGPGSLVPTQAGGVPVVVTLDGDGVLRAFANVCRHRGAIVASAPARRGTLHCPYHAWTYGLDVDRLRFHRRYAYELRANWKIAIENYLECYHCAVNHPGFVDAVDERALRLETGPTRLSHFAPVHPGALDGRAAYDARGALGMSQFHILLPATKLNVCPGHPNLSIGPVWPIAPDRCAGYLDDFFAPDVDDEWIAAFSEWDFEVGAQDVALVEAVQAGRGAARSRTVGSRAAPRR